MNYPARIALAQLPTPIEKLERLSRHLGGPEIFIKRDDQTGLAGGGNKTRKLEFVLAEALAQKCTHLVTLGGPQSNHCRQTAAAAAKLGLRCSLVLRGAAPAQSLGNLLLDELFNAELHWAGARTREEVAKEVVESLRLKGERVYLIPLGASDGLGAIGYVAAMEEALAQLAAQKIKVDATVVASSSAGTQAGLVLGAALRGYTGRVLGISIDASETELTARVSQIALDAAQLLHVKPNPLRIEVNADYLGGGYAVVGGLERDAIRTVARTEGLLLDPVYT
ncbi:MAG: D-cysteine desulfhydrase family protein, partial [Pseudonocardiaceae bacterium]